MSPSLPMICQHCGRPIAGMAVHLGASAYHFECTRGPSYAPMPPAPGAYPATPVSEERVRQIVREELQNLGKSTGAPT